MPGASGYAGPPSVLGYVTNVFENSVSVIDTTTNTVTANIPVGTEPIGIAVNSADSRVYVANFADGTVSVIDTATNTVTATIPVGLHPDQVAINPAGTLVGAVAFAALLH